MTGHRRSWVGLVASVLAAAGLTVAIGGGPSTAATTTTTVTTTTSGCVPENGRVVEIGATYLRFAIPSRSCLPQAVFFARVFQQADDGSWVTVASGSGQRDFSNPYGGTVLVTGLQPSTTYWYAFYDRVSAPRTGPVTTLATDPTPTTSTTRPPACTAQFLLREQWPGGFRADVVVTAGPAGVPGWSLRWHFVAGQQLVTSWNAEVSTAGDTVDAGNVSWNGALAPGGTTTFGLIGSWSGTNPVPTLSCT